MDIRLFNTLSKQKEIFKPIKVGEVSMYHCGPTVYDFAHIGNLRSYVFADLLRRTFEYNGYKVNQVINITDMGHLVSNADEGEDKMTKALKREGKPLTLEAMKEVGNKYFDKFRDDLNALNIELPNHFPKASDHIEEDIEIIGFLNSKNVTYTTSDGVYFNTDKFPAYGKLGNIKTEDLKDGARIKTNSEKINPSDFCLWKFDAKIGWESPWGKGFPGWHIECSAMSRKYLGQPFDIHTGGIDHIPTHHNNEIAQSETAFDKPLANYWMHNEFLNINSKKIAKSEGNSVFISTLLEGSISPLAYRYWLLTAHYRSPVNFTFEAVSGAQVALVRLIKIIMNYPKGGNTLTDYRDKFLKYINDDLDLPQAVALAWELVADRDQDDADKRATLIDFDKVFGLKLDSIPEVQTQEIPPEVQALVDTRNEARKEKDWTKADALRKEIEDRGYIVLDGESDSVVKSK